ncbi:4-dihydrotrisporin dehydrogenase [Gilbertella persicaria]|uniref:4-dihydrotrisporin dehydrogenase n=1 Tax=Gilbertella persicaria TaxID=101096 RepID=UPI002220C434|nr:4-dihydrotrisporin dehydrogenase [Gilbertella persicaria]KAI8051927.1 4-dihydrotrisporin dehydrogenase [Gilbertella persicaria]
MSLIYVVTGASRGIGLAFVKQLVKRDAIVFACARNPESSIELQDLIQANKQQIFPITIDITHTSSIQVLDQKVTSSIDVLINNAGIAGTNEYNIETTPREEYTKVFNTNVFGVSDVTKAMIPLLKLRETKKIINISSVLGSVSAMDGTRGSGQGPVYSISKSALNMMTRLTANHLQPEGFIVFAIHPGWVKTDMGGNHAPVTQEESVHGILHKVGTSIAKDCGGFFEYTGKELDW